MSTTNLRTAFLVFLAVIALVSGFFDARNVTEPFWWTLASTIILNFIVFCWYVQDSNQHAYRRSAMLNASVILLAPVAITYYVVRRSAVGKRWRSVAWIFVYCILFAVVIVAGGVIGGMLDSF